MCRQGGGLVLDDEGLAVRGLLVWNLVLAGSLADTVDVMRFLVDDISRDTYVNVMDRDHPAAKAFRHPVLNRPVRFSEVDDAMRRAHEAGLWRIYEEQRGVILFGPGFLKWFFVLWKAVFPNNKKRLRVRLEALFLIFSLTALQILS